MWANHGLSLEGARPQKLPPTRKRIFLQVASTWKGGPDSLGPAAAIKSTSEESPGPPSPQCVGWYLPVHLALLSHVDLRELAPGGQRVDVADQWQPSRPQQEEQWKGRTSKHRCACLSFWRARNLNCRSPPPWDQLALQPPRTPRGLKLQFRGHWLAELRALALRKAVTPGVA